jgi:hypothetical protein
MEKVPCETQKAIQSLDASSGPALNTQGGSGSGTGTGTTITTPAGGVPLPLLKKQQQQTMSLIKRDAAAQGLKVRTVKGLR